MTTKSTGGETRTSLLVINLGRKYPSRKKKETLNMLWTHMYYIVVGVAYSRATAATFLSQSIALRDWLPSFGRSASEYPDPPGSEYQTFLFLYFYLLAQRLHGEVPREALGPRKERGKRGDVRRHVRRSREA